MKAFRELEKQLDVFQRRLTHCRLDIPTAVCALLAAFDGMSLLRDERGHASAPLPDDRFRERFSFEGDRLEDRTGRGLGGGRQARNPTGFEQVLLELGFGHPGAGCRRRGVPAELLQRVAADIVLGGVAPSEDLVMDEPFELGGQMYGRDICSRSILAYHGGLGLSSRAVHQWLIGVYGVVIV
jgi:hypothetical protein